MKWNKDGVIGAAPLTNQATTIDLGGYGDFAVNEPYSVGCWVKPSNKRAGAIVGRMINNDPYRGWDVWQNGTEYAAHLIDTWNGNAVKVATVGNQVKQGKWQHVLVTWDGSGTPGGLKIYIDGTLAETRFEAKTLKKDANTKTTTPLLIGSRGAGTSPFVGHVQDFVLYQRKLESHEISNIANFGPLRTALEAPAEERNQRNQQYFVRTLSGES